MPGRKVSSRRRIAPTTSSVMTSSIAASIGAGENGWRVESLTGCEGPILSSPPCRASPCFQQLRHSPPTGAQAHRPVLSHHLAQDRMLDPFRIQGARRPFLVLVISEQKPEQPELPFGRRGRRGGRFGGRDGIRGGPGRTWPRARRLAELRAHGFDRHAQTERGLLRIGVKQDRAAGLLQGFLHLGYHRQAAAISGEVVQGTEAVEIKIEETLGLGDEFLEGRAAVLADETV